MKIGYIFKILNLHNNFGWSHNEWKVGNLGFIGYTMNGKLHDGWHIGLKSYNGWNVSW
jgi:hypothetical protein